MEKEDQEIIDNLSRKLWEAVDDIELVQQQLSELAEKLKPIVLLDMFK